MAAILWLIRLVFLTLNVFMGVWFVMSTTESCGSVFEFRIGYAFVGHVMATSVVGDEFECQQKCIENKTCKSFNIHPGADNTKRICELNNKTRQMKPADFNKKKGSIHYGSVKISCIDVPRDKHEQATSSHCHPKDKRKQCQTPKRGWNSRHPAHFCKDIRDSGDSRGDGKYWIDPEKNGNPLNVYCDMTTAGGGWLLISNVVMDSSTPPSQLPEKTSYREISSEQMLLTTSAMNELRRHLSFTQLRFHCSKEKGRTFHVTTADNSSGEAVVQYFSGQTDVLPASCGSFVRMENDNSSMAGVCEKWGYDNGSRVVGTWSRSHLAVVPKGRLYNHVAFVAGAYNWMLVPPRWECDDYMLECLLVISGKSLFASNLTCRL